MGGRATVRCCSNRVPRAAAQTRSLASQLGGALASLLAHPNLKVVALPMTHVQSMIKIVCEDCP